jgi:hypothetical protein
MIYCFYCTARAYLCAPRTLLTGMSGIAPVAPVPPSFYCHICELSLPSQAHMDVHDDSFIHIMRTLKLHGLPMVKCVLCDSFAVLSEEEHITLPRHLIATGRYQYFRGSPLLVVMYPMYRYTAPQFAQMTFRSSYIEVYWAHVHTHDSLFTLAQHAFAQARLHELDHGDWTSPIYSSNEEEDEKQYHTP